MTITLVATPDPVTRESFVCADGTDLLAFHTDVGIRQMLRAIALRQERIGQAWMNYAPKDLYLMASGVFHDPFYRDDLVSVETCFRTIFDLPTPETTKET